MTLTRSDMLNVFIQGIKKPEDVGIGLEREHFLYDRATKKRLTYPQIRQVFEGFLSLGWQGKYENENVIAATKDGSSLTIEPGGQFELSAKVHKNLHDAYSEMDQFENDLQTILDKLNFFKLDIGFEPFWRQEDLTWMPKGRYEIMKAYMSTKGKLGHDMMRRTATLQFNLDYTSEQNMAQMMRVCQAIHPYMAGLFAASPFYEGKLSSHQSLRNAVWQDTDPDRCGLLPFVHTDAMSFESYLDYLLNVPMYFIYRDGYINAAGRSFKDFIEGNLSDIYQGKATLDDFYDQLTVAFPEVRLKRYVEVRGIDASPLAYISAALYVGLLYDQKSLQELDQLTKEWSFEAIQKKYLDIPKNGLSSADWDIIEKIYSLSEKGLINRGLNEESYLLPLKELIEKRETQSQNLIQNFLNSSEKLDFLIP